MAIIGIDLGTTNSLVSIWRHGKAELIPNSLGTFLTPSVVSMDKDGTLWTGTVAREKMHTQPERSAASFKRQMGTAHDFRLGNHIFKAAQLSSLILKQLKLDAEAYLGEPVEEAVISVPAYFNDEQRFATKQAGQLAGLKVERLVNEPSAAALACRNQTGEDDSQFLVIDFGGGTLDVSVVECFEQIIEIQAVAGDNHLGGNDFDMLIAEYFCGQHGLDYESMTMSEQNLLLKKAEQCKRELTASQAAMMNYLYRENELGLFLTTADLVRICAPLFKRLEKVVFHALSDAGKTVEDIDQIVLVGGTCKMPAVQQYIGHFLHREPFLAGQPDEIIALGAGIYGGIKERRSDIKDIILTDICPFTLGIGIIDRNNGRDHIMSPIIERNSPLPTSKSGFYVTTRDLQTDIGILVFQGESMHCSENLFLGELNLTVPPAPNGQEGVVVRFTYDINGILDVEAENRHGDVVKKLIMNERIRMDSQELDEKMQELEQLKRPAREQAVNQLVFSRGERLYMELLGDDRQVILNLLNWFSGVLAAGSPAAIAAARKKTDDTFNYLESKLYGGVWWQTQYGTYSAFLPHLINGQSKKHTLPNAPPATRKNIRKNLTGFIRLIRRRLRRRRGFRRTRLLWLLPGNGQPPLRTRPLRLLPGNRRPSQISPCWWSRAWSRS